MTATPDKTLDDLREHFDHVSVETGTELRAHSTLMREECPIARSDRHGGFWTVSRHEDVTKVFSAHRTYLSAHGNSIPELPFPSGLPTCSDEPLHTSYRKVLWPFLTPQAVSTYEPFLRAAVNELIDSFIEAGSAEIVKQFAKPIPSMAITQFFRLSTEDSLRCLGWIDDATELGATDPEAAGAAAINLFSFLRTFVEDARTNPAGDVIGAIVNAEIDGRLMTDDEAVGMVFASLAGAIETTVSAITQAVALLAKHPEQRQRLVDDPSLSFGAVEEILRYESPTPAIARTVKEEAQLGDETVRAGDKVLMLIDAANFDPRRFDDPNEFRIDREGSAHLTFGHGVHKCQGMHLARLELRIVLEEFLARIPTYTIAEEPDSVIRGGAIKTVPRLVIEFEPGPKVSANTAVD